MLNKNLIVLILLRVKSKNPKFFNRIIFVGVVILLLDATFYGALKLSLFGFTSELNEKLITGTYALGTFIAGVITACFLATTDPSLVSEDTKANINEENNLMARQSSELNQG